MQEKVDTIAWSVRNVELQQTIINLGTNPIETKFVENLFKEKDDEIQRLKNKLQMCVTQHPDSLEPIS